MNQHAPATQFVAYYRVSTTGQGESGLGLDAQRAAVQAYLNAHPGAELVAELTEMPARSSCSSIGVGLSASSAAPSATSSGIQASRKETL